MKYTKRILAAMLCLVLVFGLASCTGGEENPKDAVTKTMDALKEGKLLTVKRNVIWADMALLETGMKKVDGAKDLLDALFNKMTYEIKGEPVVDGDKATMAIAITTKDIKTVLTSYMISTVLGSLTKKQTMDENMINKEIPKVIELLNADTVKTVTKEVTVQLKKEKNKWKVEVDTDLENGILGGASSLVKYFIRLASGETTTKSSTSGVSTTVAKTTKAAGPSTTLSKEQKEQASKMQASVLAEISKKAAQNTSKTT